MRYARALIPTLKEAAVDATSMSRVQRLRGGCARREGAGSYYSYLPLGRRSDVLGTEPDLTQPSIIALDRVRAQVSELVQRALGAPSADEAA
jgi:hypothetical protein